LVTCFAADRFLKVSYIKCIVSYRIAWRKCNR